MEISQTGVGLSQMAMVNTMITSLESYLKTRGKSMHKIIGVEPNLDKKEWKTFICTALEGVIRHYKAL